MITYISEPLRATHSVTGHDVLIIALFVPIQVIGTVSATQTPRVVYVTDDGAMGQAEIGELNINWRFDDRERKWLDVDTGEDLNGNITDERADADGYDA